MEHYIGYFFSGDSIQFRGLFAVLATWAGLTTLGAFALGPRRLVEGDMITGWALASLTFTVVGVLFAVRFDYLTWGLLAAMAGTAMALAKRSPPIPVGALKAVALALPMLLLASAMMASQWDEFSHWVPTIRYVVTTNDFPRGADVVTGGAFPGYPYNWIFLPYLASWIAGRFLENAGGIFNVLLLVTFGLAAARVALLGAGQGVTLPRSWTVAALAVAAGMLLNPTFVQKVVLTAYADTSTAVCVGFGGLLAWRLLEALAAGDRRQARTLAWQFGLAMAVLINIKQSNLVLEVMLLGGLVLATLRDPAVSWREGLRFLPALLGPSILIYGLWRRHLMTELSTSSEAMLRPFADWNVDILGQILLAMLSVLAKKGAFLALMLVAVVFAIRGLARVRGPLDRLAIIVGSVFLGYNAFLLFVFVAQFGAYDAARVASYWRYNMHLGLLGVLFGAYGAGLAWARWISGRVLSARVAWLPIVLVLVLPLVFASKLRFDLEPRLQLYRIVGAEAATVLPKGARVAILDPLGTGESGVITRYEIGLERDWTGYLAQYHVVTADNIRRFLEGQKPSHVLVHTVTSHVREAVGLDLEEGRSHLLESDGAGGWRVVRSWPHPERNK